MKNNKISVKEIIKKHYQKIGKKGGLIGGKARAAALTPERRKEIAVNAANKRWKKL